MPFSIAQGATLPSLSVTLRDELGDPVDLTGSSVDVRVRQVGAEDPLFTRAGTISDAAGGRVRLDWVDGDTDVYGTYEAEWIVSIAGETQIYPGTGPLEFAIEANATNEPSEDYGLVFCTPAEAKALTGHDIDLQTMALAQTVISMRTGIQPTTDDVSPTYYDGLDDQDQIGLRQATAFQAKWLEGQPDYLERIAVSQESADGLSRVYLPSALVLAPLAEWALSNTTYGRAAVEGTVETPRAGSENGIELIPYGTAYPYERGWRPW